MARVALLLCLVVCLGACQRDLESESLAEPPGEQLIASPPEGWQTRTSAATPGLRVMEFVAPASDEAASRESIRFESTRGDPLPDPIDMVVGLAEDLGERCEGFQDHNTFSGLENGYPTSVRLLLCREDGRTGRAQVTLVKAIQGNAYTYIVARTRSAPSPASGLDLMSPEDMASWSLYMRTITVCDATRDGHPCPIQTKTDAEGD